MTGIHHLHTTSSNVKKINSDQNYKEVPLKHKKWIKYGPKCWVINSNVTMDQRLR